MTGPAFLLVPFRGTVVKLDPAKVEATLANRPPGPVEWAAAVDQAAVVGNDRDAAMELLTATLGVVRAAEAIAHLLTDHP